MGSVLAKHMPFEVVAGEPRGQQRLPSVPVVQYRGRQWPVPYWGPSQSLAVTIKGLALTLRDLDQFRQIATYAGPVWYRDPDGRSFPISMESIQYAAGLGALPGIEVSITATKIGN